MDFFCYEFMCVDMTVQALLTIMYLFYMMSPAKDLNIGSIFQVWACGFDHGSTQNLIFGPGGLWVILQHFLEGFFEIFIFSDLTSSFFPKPSKSHFKKFHQNDLATKIALFEILGTWLISIKLFCALPKVSGYFLVNMGYLFIVFVYFGIVTDGLR